MILISATCLYSQLSYNIKINIIFDNYNQMTSIPNKHSTYPSDISARILGLCYIAHRYLIVIFFRRRLIHNSDSGCLYNLFPHTILATENQNYYCDHEWNYYQQRNHPSKIFSINLLLHLTYFLVIFRFTFNFMIHIFNLPRFIQWGWLVCCLFFLGAIFIVTICLKDNDFFPIKIKVNVPIYHPTGSKNKSIKRRKRKAHLSIVDTFYSKIAIRSPFDTLIFINF